MFQYIKKYKMQNIILLFIILLWGFTNVIGSISLTWLLDALINKKWNEFIFWAIIDILCWAGYSYLQALKDTKKERLMQLQVNCVREDILNPLTMMPYAEFKKNSKEEYNSWLVNDMNLLRDNGFSQFYGAIESVVTVLLNAIAIIYFHWILLLASILMTVFVYYSPKMFQNRVAKVTDDVSESSNQAMGKSADYFNGFEVFHHNNQGNYFKTQILSSFQRLIDPKVKLVKISTIANSCSMMASVIAQVVMFIVTGYLVMNGSVTTGVIFSIANLTSCLFNYTRGAAYNIVTLKATFRLLDKYPKPYRVPQLETITHFEDKIALHDLSVTFESGQSISYPNIEIKKGMKVAITGESGSGKSTLIQLLVGDLLNYQGTISIDGYDYKRLDVKSLHDNIALIMQKPHIFRETFEENLTIGRNIEERILSQALKDSQALEFVQGRLNEVYDENISGGQKARLSIARELMGNKPILILDEATANLDKSTALAIEQTLLQNPELTVIIITHHLYEENHMLFDQIIKL